MGEEELVLRAAIRDELSGPLAGIRDEVRGLGRDADTTGRQASRASKGFDVLGKAGKIAAVGAAAAFGAALAGGYALLRLGKAAYGEAMEARKVGAVTAQIIKTTGAAAWTSSKQIGALATSISNKVGIDDEAIQSGANLLLTFKQVRNEVGKGNDIFNRATQAATDLSSIPGFGDLAGSAKMLGKALNDPLKGLTAMGRAGVTFTQDQQDRVKWLVEHNQLLEAQKIILGEVESQVGGNAAAQATWADKASVAWGNLEERLGNSLLPVLEDVSRWFVRDGVPQVDQWVGLFERRGIPAIREFAETWLPRFKDGAQQAYDTLWPLAKSALPVAADVFDRIADTVKVLAPLLVDVFDGFNGLPSWAKTAIIAGAGVGAVGQKLGIWQKLLAGGGAGGGLPGLLSAARGATPATALWVRMAGTGVPDVPGVPGEPDSPSSRRFGRFGPALTAVPQVAALAATGYMAYRTERQIEPGIKRSLATTALPAGGPSMGSSSGDWAAAHPEAARADAGGAALNDAAAAGKWVQVLRLTREYDGALAASVKGMAALRGVGHQFTTEFGVSLEDANRVMGDKLPRSADQLRDRIGRTIAKQSELTPAIMGNKAAADQLLDRFGLIAKDWRAKVTLDTGTAELRLASFQSKLNQLSSMDIGLPVGGSGKGNHRENGGPVKAGRGYLVGERRAEWFVPRVDGYIKPRVPEPAATPAGRSSAAAGTTITVAEGAVVVHNPASTVDLEAALVDGIERWMRDREENS